MKIGIIGQNEGNGHPYSFSAIFNGYDKKNLIKHCPFSLIKDYLPKYQTDNNIIKKAKVTHIWTQDKSISKKIAKVSFRKGNAGIVIGTGGWENKIEEKSSLSFTYSLTNKIFKMKSRYSNTKIEGKCKGKINL